MTTPEPVEPYRPPPQWSRADLEAARSAGDYRRISAALDSGQLATVLSEQRPIEPRRYPRISTPISDKDLPWILKNQQQQEQTP